MDLTEKAAIITGASGQLGQAIATSLAEKGMNVVCHYHAHRKMVDQAIAAIEQTGRRAVAVRTDLADPAAPDIIFEQAAKLGSVRVLINSASVFERNPIGTFSHADVSGILAVNLTAPLMLCGAFANYMKEQGIDWKNTDEPLAAIINMVDVGAVKPWAQYSPYCAGRAGLVAATKSLARELAPGITVNAVAPGIVTWPGKMDPSEEDKQLKMIPAGRFGEPKDITRTINFLLDNPYITGQTLCVDGGRTI
jgi:NAD(P)-dependent dehydrogenase (short-subunit alcohol dehydrogenase family)